MEKIIALARYAPHMYVYIWYVYLEIIHLVEMNGNALLETLPNDIEIRLGVCLLQVGAKTHKQCPRNCLFSCI